MKTESCIVYDLCSYKTKIELQKLSEMISSIACDREKLPYSISFIKSTILKTSSMK